jgi:hypothetical protein
MLGTRIISSGVGGLAEQLGPGDLIAETNRDLVAALRDVAAARSGPDA